MKRKTKRKRKKPDPLPSLSSILTLNWYSLTYALEKARSPKEYDKAAKRIKDFADLICRITKPLAHK